MGFCQSSHQKNTIDLVENSVSGGGGETIECEFKRGICKFHDIKGKKLVLRTSKWCNVKGTFKWRYSSKVVWQCLARNNPVAKIQDPPPADDNTSKGDSLCEILRRAATRFLRSNLYTSVICTFD